MSLDAEVSLSTVTQEVVDMVYYSFCCSKDKQTILKRDVALIMDLDQTNEVDWRCRIALGAWKRIIMNLVGNALKYTQTGYVYVTLEKLDSSASFTIRDSGCGMSQSFLNDRLFNAFAQEDSFAEGTGLGMSLVASILKAIEGKIEVQSEQNVGTTVTVTIPLVDIVDRKLSTISKAGMESTVDVPADLVVLMPDVKEDVRGTQQPTPAAVEAQRLLIASMANACDTNDIRMATTDDCYSASTRIQIILEKQLCQLYPDASRSIEPSTKVLDGVTGPPNDRDETPLIVVCDSVISLRELRSTKEKLPRHRHVELLAQPVGPDRILKAIQACLSAQEPGAKVNDVDHLSVTATTASATNGALSEPATNLDGEEIGLRPRISFVDEVILAPCTPIVDRSDPFPAPFVGTSFSNALRISEGAEKDEAPILSPTSQLLNSPLVPKIAHTQPAASNTTDLLLVDDNLINLKLLSTFAKKHAHRHLLAHNGQHAVEAYKAACMNTPLPPHLFAIQGAPTSASPKRPRVVLMDINMPVMDGYEATRQIRSYEHQERLRPSTIIALTGLGSASAQQEAYACGIDLFMTKPVKLKELRKILDGVVQE